MKNIFIQLVTLVILQTVSAQNLLVNWQQCLGGSENDMGYSMIPTWNGYMLLCGTESNDGQVQSNHGHSDFWLVRTDTLGAILWSQTFGGSESEEKNSIVKCSDGGFVSFGDTYSNDGNVSGNHGDADYWIFKIDSLGSLLWQKCLGGSYTDRSNKSILTPDSGFLMTGGSMSVDGNVSGNHGFFDCWMVKLDQDGNLQWEKSLGGTGADIGTSVKTTSDGGYIVGATTDKEDGDVQCNVHGFVDTWIIKLDAMGGIEWQNCYGGTQGEGPREILQTSDGGYIFAGTTNSNDGDVSGNHGQNDFWVVKIDSVGSLQWQRCYGGSKEDVAMFIRQSANGSFIVGGYTFSNDGDVTGNHSYPTTYDAWLLRISPDGDILWAQCIGGDENENFADMIEFHNGKITLLGGSNTWDYSGDVQCESHGHSRSDIWFVGMTDTSVVGMVEQTEESDKLEVYPNPAGDYIHFKLIGSKDPCETRITLVNVVGKLINEIIIPPGQQEVSFPVANLLPGYYSYVLSNRHLTESGKILITR